MTEATLPLDPESLNSGKPAGLYLFLALAIQRGDIPQAQGNNLRGSARKVLEVGDNDDVDLRAVDLDDLVRRFHIKCKVDLKDESRATYEKRFRAAVDKYTKFLADDPSWKFTMTRKSKPTTSRPTVVPDPEPSGATVTTMPVRHEMVDIPVPLRPGVVARLSFPADLSDREAKRIATIVEAYSGGLQLALPAGRANDV